MRTRRGGRRDGFILVAVLGVMALLASLMGGSALLVRAAFEGARAKSDDLALEGLLRAGLDLAAHELYALRLPPALIEGQAIRLDAGTVTLSVTDEAGLIDLNGADPALIAAAYRAAGGRMRPEDFAARLVAWRDRYEPKGAPAPAPLPAGSEGAPAGGQPNPHRREGFRTVGELRVLPGLDAETLVALAGLVTVANPGGKVDLTSAPLPVLLALPGMSPRVAAQILALRRRPGPDTPERLAALARPQAAFVATRGGGGHRVRLEARTGAGAARTAEAVITRAPAKLAPYFVVEWSG